MTKQGIIERVNSIMAAKVGIDPNDIKPEDFYDELGADSIQCIEVLMEIEKVFIIDIPSDRLMRVTTMQHVYDLVEQVLSEEEAYANQILKQTL
jgi:acyl carrier protein